MGETGTLDEVSLSFEDAGDTMVMRRHYKRQFTPEEAKEFFLQWFVEGFLPLTDDNEAKAQPLDP